MLYNNLNFKIKCSLSQLAHNCSVERN